MLHSKNIIIKSFFFFFKSADRCVFVFEATKAGESFRSGVEDFYRKPIL